MSTCNDALLPHASLCRSCAMVARPAVSAVLGVGEPNRHRDPMARKGGSAIVQSIVGPFVEFFQRQGALLVLLFILIHKIGDTLANLTLDRKSTRLNSSH